MYKFIEELKHNGALVDEKIFKDMRIRILNHINFDKNVIMNVQASMQHYCIPKQTTNLENYKKMELSFIRNDVFTNFENITNNKELSNKLKKYELGEIYAYVPCELIEEIYQQLILEFRNQNFNKHDGRKI